MSNKQTSKETTKTKQTSKPIQIEIEKKPKANKGRNEP